VPAWTQVVSGFEDVTALRTLPAASGGVLYLKVFQNDGCPSGWSLADP
jgi:hypothetical protein